MPEVRWRPSLPQWVQFPRVAWFVVEGVAIGLAGLLVRTALSGIQTAVTFGNIAFVVGTTTALLGVVAYIVLAVFNR